MMVTELERLTREEFGAEPASHLDYVELYVASGGTLLKLAEEISDKVGQKIYREVLSNYVNTLNREASADTLSSARARGARAKAERAELIAAGATKDTAAADALLVRALQWSAERDDPRSFGQQKGVSVAISFGDMHLAALQRRSVAVAVISDPQPAALLEGTSDDGADVQVVDAE